MRQIRDERCPATISQWQVEVQFRQPVPDRQVRQGLLAESAQGSGHHQFQRLSKLLRLLCVQPEQRSPRLGHLGQML